MKSNASGNDLPTLGAAPTLAAGRPFGFTLPSQTGTRRLLLLVLMGICIGCGGDNQNAGDPAKDQKTESVDEPDFEVLDATVLPGKFATAKPFSTGDEDEDQRQLRAWDLARNRRRRTNQTKLGHWVAAQMPLIANNFDASGSMTTEVTDTGNRVVRHPGTNYVVESSRPFSLPRSEWKNLESMVYLPVRGTNPTSIDLRTKLSWGSLSPLTLPAQNVTLMQPFQYHWVVLSNRPDAYRYLAASDVVGLPVSGINGPFPDYFNLVTSQTDQPIPLPRQALAWTTLAHVWWDDMEEDQLDSDQQQALLDWVHFGGQLVISGPDALDRLQSGFLADYLPGRSTGTRSLRNVDFEALNRHWSIPAARNQADRRELVVSSDAPLVGLQFELDPAAQFMTGTGELVAERRVGRGRIVVTLFSLDDTPFVKWRSVNSFIHNCLLRRPPRTFVDTELVTSFRWEERSTSLFDPLLGSALRYTSRDLGPEGTAPTAAGELLVSDSDMEMNQIPGAPSFSNRLDEFEVGRVNGSRDLNDIWRYGGFNNSPFAGTAGWNDRSAISNAARTTLREAAGISPPDASFVLQLLSVYLLVLVPLNWLFFRLLGHVEWAWIAAPLIAIAGAIAVVKLAALDIGFVRSNTQVGLLEAYAGFPRGHATEYSALYTSLSTGYDIELDNAAAQSLPFPSDPEANFANLSPSVVTLKRAATNRLEGFQIQSNRTGLLHTEYMTDMDGPFEYLDDAPDTPRVRNGTRFPLSAAVVLRRRTENTFEAAEIGDLAADSNSAPLVWKTVSPNQLLSLWDAYDVAPSHEQIANRIWSQVGGGDGFVSFDRIREADALNGRRAEFDNIASDVLGESDAVAVDGISKGQLRRILARMEPPQRVHAGLLLQQIVQLLEMEVGEVRMIGITDQPCGKTRFDPESTQTQRANLVLVYLFKPPLPPVGPDRNALDDFNRRSNLEPGELDPEEQDDLQDPDIDAQGSPSRTEFSLPECP